MNNQINKSNISSIIQSNIILIGVCIFVFVFIVLNYNKVVAGETSNLNIGNTILVTLISILLLYLFTFEDEPEYKEEELEIPKFKLNEVNKDEIKDVKGGGKYRISNNKYSNINDFDNQNIFISQKHIGRYGIKF
jgi:hypothetical protein